MHILCIYCRTKTIWDPAKRTSNLAKHGVDFLDVDDAFWSDPMALTLEDSDHYEQRFVSIAANGFGAVLVVVYSYPDEQAIRVISARRAEPLERKQYEEGR
jgi:uncharacterized DUF497 family protein